MGWAALTGLLLAGMTAATPPTAIPVRGGNALTLPAHRHIVRVSRSEGSVLLTAVQQGGQDGHGLRLFRSDNGGGTWKQEGVIHDGSTYDRADLVAVGRDVALVYAVETPDSTGIGGSTARDVYFQWWRYSASKNHWLPDKPVRVFDSTSSSTAYYRAELARDSKGRLWVQAFFREKDASNTLVISVSSDGGSTFRTQSALARDIPKRGGGRLISLGSRLMMLWSSHDGRDTTHYRIRDDSASVSTWSSTRTAFSDGIYHGAAMSAVADGKGGLHLVYKDNSERLRYRRFDGSSFGSAVKVLEDGDWATQPALVRAGSSLYLFYNQPRSDGSGYRLWVRALSSSGKPGAGRELASVSGFAGYPAAPDVLPSGVPLVCFFGIEPSSGSSSRLSFFSTSASSLKSQTVAARQAPAAEDEDGERFTATGGPAASPPPQDPGALVSAATSPSQQAMAAGCGGASAMLAVGVTFSLMEWGRRRRAPVLPG
ncbi:sialidase family protein [Corallococcus sp. AS-1-6]|uniref:sialidase family protein n=1 Tax=Corallococcus sp. AS-1-6 TaxID=2874599 RepID=UPI001CBB4DE2|nr:sialidase family protein [Corallococcus sp. AS-1-6]MBZ4376827.1 glycoside hydrolase [Corallococcus sp. AS-1-6]